MYMCANEGEDSASIIWGSNRLLIVDVNDQHFWYTANKQKQHRSNRRCWRFTRLWLFQAIDNFSRRMFSVWFRQQHSKRPDPTCIDIQMKHYKKFVLKCLRLSLRSLLYIYHGLNDVLMNQRILAVLSNQKTIFYSVWGYHQSRVGFADWNVSFLSSFPSPF